MGTSDVSFPFFWKMLTFDTLGCFFGAMLSAFCEKKWSPVQFAGVLAMNEKRIGRKQEYQQLE